MKLKIILLVVTFVLLVYYLEYTLSLSLPFTTPKTCSVTFNSSCASHTLDDAFLGCNGTDTGTPCYVREVITNQTSFLPNSGINATCDYMEASSYNGTVQIWYYNGSNWYNILNTTKEGTGIAWNESVTFKLNSTSGVHIVRCIIGCVLSNPAPSISGECSNSTYTLASKYDTDDVNFTVTDYPKYTFWNLTNYTTGATIQDGSHLTRNDTINASAQWDKQLYNANISHNGTGTFQNYTISSITGTWTNYTLNLSNTNEFNRTGRIEISYIWVNDTYGLENYTSSKYFYLWGNSKIGQIYINQTSIYNNTGAGIFCQVLDKDLNQPILSYNVSFYRNDGGG
jgi:hypothetical protein